MAAKDLCAFEKGLPETAIVILRKSFYYFLRTETIKPFETKCFFRHCAQPVPQKSFISPLSEKVWGGNPASTHFLLLLVVFQDMMGTEIFTSHCRATANYIERLTTSKKTFYRYL